MVTMEGVALFLHAVEVSDHHWSCHRGLAPADGAACLHPSATEALEHLRRVSQQIEGAARIMLHFGDGAVQFEPPEA